MAFVSTPLPLRTTAASTNAATSLASTPAGAFAPNRSATLHQPKTTQSTSGPISPPAMNFRLRTAIVTGASSSIGLHAAKNLVARGDYHVVMAVRNIEKAAAAAKSVGMPIGSYTILPLDLANLNSVRNFVAAYRLKRFPALNALVCNAAIWHPKDKEPRFTVDGYDETVQVNHLGHFLLANLLLPQIKLAQGRVVFLATQTHNPDTLPGKIPPQADLGNMAGLARGFRSMPGTIDGKEFEPTKAYKDSKVCNILTMTEMNRRFGTDGVTFSAVFPGCIAESDLFREKRGWFRWFFPIFQKYITKQYVSVEEAGRRVALVAAEAGFEDSGRYWQWRGSYLQGTDKTSPVPIDPTEKEAGKAAQLYELSSKLVNMSA